MSDDNLRFTPKKIDTEFKEFKMNRDKTDDERVSIDAKPKVDPEEEKKKAEEQKALDAKNEEERKQQEQQDQFVKEHQNTIDNSFVTVSDDKMSVILNLCSPGENKTYTVADIVRLLRHYEVKQGINRKRLQEMIDQGNYYNDVIVATGKSAIDGNDGEFIYHFRTEIPTLPKILEDGSVDYKNMELFEEVKSGQLLAEYKPATQGEFGYDVEGNLLKPMKGRDFPTLRMKGVMIDDDKKNYYASLDGMVELQDNLLEVRRLYVVKGDVDVETGNIDFSGDVTVYGNVQSGFIIQAGGNVIVEGHVEAAEIYAGKNILLKKGMQGNATGVLRAEGSVSGMFMESVTIHAKETINASYLLNCNVSTDDKVVISGRKGVIIGGETKATGGISCYGVGNVAEIPTTLEVGIGYELTYRHQEIGKLLSKIDSEMNLFQEGIIKVSKVLEKEKNALSMYNKLKQAYQMKGNEKKELIEERNNILDKMNSASNSRISVKGIVFPGTLIIIDTNKFRVQEAYKGIEFVRSGEKIIPVND